MVIIQCSHFPLKGRPAVNFPNEFLLQEENSFFPSTAVNKSGLALLYLYQSIKVICYFNRDLQMITHEKKF